MVIAKRSGGPRVQGACARTAMAAMLAASLATAAAAPATALAETGSVTVNAIEGNVDNTYKVFRLFKADIDNRDMATHIAWDVDAKAATLAFADANGYNEWLAAKLYNVDGAHDNAQNCAEFLAERIEGSAAAAGAATTPATKDSASFANRLARALAKAGIPPQTATVGEAFTDVEGYYHIVTDPASIAGEEAATAPIWLALGGSVTSITEKSALPTIDKKVRGAGDLDWSNATDAFYLQDIDFKITGTLPSNIRAFTTYHYKITDTLSGLDMKDSNASSVKVTVDGADITSQLAGDVGSITYEAGVLVVDIADALSLEGVDITKDSQVVVEYKAHAKNPPDGNAANGGTNSVTLTYTNDPVTDGEGTGLPKTVKTFSYVADLVKIDKNNKQKLGGAKFTVQVEEYVADPSLEGKYVQADGQLGDSPHEFVSDSDGTLSIPGLDAATYTIAETQAPEGYELQDADITLSISSHIDGQGAVITDLTATVSGGEAASVEGDESTKLISVNADTGVIQIQAADDKTFQLANTGLSGIGAYMAIASGLAVAGGGGLVTVRLRGRRSDED